MHIQFKPEVELRGNRVKGKQIALTVPQLPSTESILASLQEGCEEDLPLPAQDLPFYYYMLNAFKKQALLIYQSSLMEVVPFDKRFEIRPPSKRAYSLSRFAICRPLENAIVIETPLCAARLHIRKPEGMQLFYALSRPLTLEAACNAFPSIPPQDILEAFTLLHSAHLICDEEEREASNQWEPHDLYFHSRCRVGRHDMRSGSTFRFEGKYPSQPAIKVCTREERIELPRPDQSLQIPFGEVFDRRRSIRKYGTEPLSIEQLGAFLYHSSRVTKEIRQNNESFAFRPYPGGGGRYELEIYPVIYNCSGIEQGVYHYHPREHRLCLVSSFDARAEEFLKGAQSASLAEGYPHVLFVIGARFQRVSWKYESMAYATILKNTGVLYQTFYLVATAMGLAPCAIGCGDADLFCEVMGTDYLKESSVGEFMLGSVPTT